MILPFQHTKNPVYPKFWHVGITQKVMLTYQYWIQYRYFRYIPDSPTAASFMLSETAKVSQHPAYMDHAILHGKLFGAPLLQEAE